MLPKESEVAYVCDPEKNIECQKRGCQKDCFHTKDIQYRDKDAPLIFKQSLFYRQGISGDK